jgi:hypothetical protein
MFGGRLVSRIFEEFQKRPIQTKIVKRSGAFFHQIKVCQRIGKKDSTYTRTSRQPKNEEIGDIFVISGLEL